jgi:hypothetical protein
VTVKVTGWPAVGEAGVYERPTVTLVPTVTLAVAVLSATLAVTSASRFVVNDACASPLLFVVAELAESVPAVVVNVTGMPGSRLPEASSTEAVMVTVPPLDGTREGDADSVTAFAEAAPI